MSQWTKFFAAASFVSVIGVVAHAEDVIPLVNWQVAPWSGSGVTVAAPVKGDSQNYQKDISSTGFYFVPMEPCRVVDSRNAAGPFGGPGFTANETRTYNVPAHPTCTGIPATAIAYSLNFTIVGYSGSGGWVTAFPSGTARPFVSTVNFGTGPAVANAAVVPASAAGQIDVYATNPTHVIVDINGYFIGSRIKALTATTTPGTYSALLFGVTVPPGTGTGGTVPFTVFATGPPNVAVGYGTMVYVAHTGSVNCVTPTATQLKIGSIAFTASPSFCAPPGETSARPCCALNVSGMMFVPTTINVRYEMMNQPGTGVTAIP